MAWRFFIAFGAASAFWNVAEDAMVGAGVFLVLAFFEYQFKESRKEDHWDGPDATAFRTRA